MTAKKHWFKKVYSQSQEKTSHNNVSISWSSSEEDEPTPQKNAKMYSECDKKCNEWIKKTNDLWKTYKSRIQCVQDKEIQPVILDVSKQIESDESPILCGDKVSNMSPVLTQYKCSSEKSSPILGKGRKIRKRIPCCLNEQNMTRVSEITTVNSPDLFSVEQSQDICNISTSSLTGYTKENSQVVSQDSQRTEVCAHSISILPSQDSTEVLINSNSQESSDRKSDQYLLLYKQPLPKKKRYRKDGLCSQIQKVMRTQKSRILIWQHETFVKKSENISITDESLSIIFSLKKQWTEFGCSFYECAYIKSEEAYSESPLNSKLSNNDEVFILLIGYNVIPNLTYKTESKYIIYPPYSKRTITYKNSTKICYFNVSKVKKYMNDL